MVEGDTVLVDCNGETKIWRFLEGGFSREASNLRARFSSLIDTDRSSGVRIAVPDSLVDTGLLFATLPADQATGLPFHIDADFFPASDRKSIVFEDSNDPSMANSGSLNISRDLRRRMIRSPTPRERIDGYYFRSP